MTTTARIGVILLVLFLVWIVVYYQLVAPALEEPTPPAGLQLTSGDSIGTSPDEANDRVILTDDGRESHGPNDTITTPPSNVNPNERLASNENSGASGNDRESAGGNNTNNANNDADADNSGAKNNPVLPAPPATTPYTVKKGDTMQTIAKDWFGSTTKWVLIAQENPLADPMKLKVGQSLRLPAKDAKPESIPPELYAELTREIRYVVSPGDTLSGIAKRFYNKPGLYRIIYEANRDVIPNPDSLVVGTEIVIPKYQQPAD